jgi:hypothetical protein
MRMRLVWRGITATMLTLPLLECGDSGPVSVTRVLTTITVTVAVPDPEIGQFTVATAATLDQYGAPIAAGPVTFASSAPAIAAISPTTGEILPLSAGTTEISASVDGLSGSQTITVSRAAIRVNEVAPRGSATGGSVELFNPTAGAVDLTGWTITSGNVFQSFPLPAGSMIPAGGFFEIAEANFPAGLQAPDAVHLFSRFGVQVDAFAWTADPVTSYGRCPDGSGDFVSTTAPTPGAANACIAPGALR